LNVSDGYGDGDDGGEQYIVCCHSEYLHDESTSTSVFVCLMC